jgi:hypothetical protein
MLGQTLSRLGVDGTPSSDKLSKLNGFKFTPPHRWLLQQASCRSCLFVLFSFYVLHPEGVCGLLQKKPAAAPAYKPQQKKYPTPSVRSAHFSGYGSPLQILTKEVRKRTKEKGKGKI